MTTIHFFCCKKFLFCVFFNSRSNKNNKNNDHHFNSLFFYYSLITGFLFKKFHVSQDTFGFNVHPNQFYFHHIHRKVILLLILYFETFGLAKKILNVFLFFKSSFSLLILKICFFVCWFFCGTLVFFYLFVGFFVE
jgi:hypothetical protein